MSVNILLQDGQSGGLNGSIKAPNGGVLRRGSDFTDNDSASFNYAFNDLNNPISFTIEDLSNENTIAYFKNNSKWGGGSLYFYDKIPFKKTCEVQIGQGYIPYAIRNNFLYCFQIVKSGNGQASPNEWKLSYAIVKFPLDLNTFSIGNPVVLSPSQNVERPTGFPASSHSSYYVKHFAHAYDAVTDKLFLVWGCGYGGMYGAGTPKYSDVGGFVTNATEKNGTTSSTVGTSASTIGGVGFGFGENAYFDSSQNSDGMNFAYAGICPKSGGKAYFAGCNKMGVLNFQTQSWDAQIPLALYQNPSSHYHAILVDRDSEHFLELPQYTANGNLVMRKKTSNGFETKGFFGVCERLSTFYTGTFARRMFSGYGKSGIGALNGFYSNWKGYTDFFISSDTKVVLDDFSMPAIKGNTIIVEGEGDSGKSKKIAIYDFAKNKAYIETKTGESVGARKLNITLQGGGLVYVSGAAYFYVTQIFLKEPALSFIAK